MVTMLVQDNDYVRDCHFFLNEMNYIFSKEDIGYMISYFSWELLIDTKIRNYTLYDESREFKILGNEDFLTTILNSKHEFIFDYCLELTKNNKTINDYFYLTFVTLLASIKMLENELGNDLSLFDGHKERYSVENSKTMYEMLQYL